MKLESSQKKEYLSMVKKEMPKTRHLETMVKAFFVGGIICSIGQGVNDLLAYLLPSWAEKDIASLATFILISLTGILTGFGIYDRIGNFGGAGSIIPITGFANSVVSPAIEHKREGYILGMCTNMFTVAGPVIVMGITASVIVGIIYLFV